MDGGLLYYPESELFEKAFNLQFRSQEALGGDRNLGKKLSSYFSEVNLHDVQLSVSSGVYSSPEKRQLLAKYSIAAWNESPWAKHALKKSWVSSEEIKAFQQELLNWEKNPVHLFRRLGAKPLERLSK